MGEPIPKTVAAKPKRGRLRFGLRGMIGAVLVLGLILGGIARKQRQITEREFLIADVSRDHIVVNWTEPTYLCLFLMKVLSTSPRGVEASCSKWLGPGWFSNPKGFNAGHLKDDQTHSVVKRLSRLGTVWEITYTQPTLTGLKLFFIDKVPYHALGPQAATCEIKRCPLPGGSS
jgi:hypothetical protein